MAFILGLASLADPDVFVGDGVRVFSCYGYAAVREGFGAFARPKEVYEKGRLRIDGVHQETKFVCAA